jgi:hypothetical protein
MIRFKRCVLITLLRNFEWSLQNKTTIVPNYAKNQMIPFFTWVACIKILDSKKMMVYYSKIYGF